MRILVTAFEPFGGEQTNPSLLVLDALKPGYQGAELAKLALPVVFSLSARRLFAALAMEQPDAVLMLGQAGGRAGLGIERVAINLDDADIADNAGQQPADRPIAEGGPAAYFSTLPIRAMLRAVRDAGMPAGISNTAGTFVCNHLLYQALHHIALHKLPVTAGFIHLPYLPAQAETKNPPAPSMALADQVLATEASISAIAQALSR